MLSPSAGLSTFKKPVRRGRAMAEGSTQTFSDPDRYAAAFDDTRITLTVAGAGEFAARLTRLRLQHIDVYRCRESLPRIAYISLPPQRTVLSFPIGSGSPLFGGCALKTGDIVHHSRCGGAHQRSSGPCQWGLTSFSASQLASCGEALTGHPFASPRASRVLRPQRADALRFQRLFGQACRLATSSSNLISQPEIARALEQAIFYAAIHCLGADYDITYKACKQHYNAALMVRFEEVLRKYVDQRLNIPALCAEVGVAERTLRMYCAEVLGVSPTRYLLLQRLNRARAALRHADPSTASVAQIALNNQFLELGRFAVTYRSIFGESPSSTLQRDPRK